MTKWLEKWFTSNCNGNWEHDHVIKIETIDNPGWSVEINFNNTGVVRNDFSWEIYEISNTNWIGYKIEDNIFYSSGDSLKLSLIIEVFRGIIENESLNQSYINSIINKGL